MTNEIQSIAIDRFVPHPDNPNRISKANFAKLLANIERTGRYEPLVVRPHPDRPGYFQIINGHHRWQVLSQLGYKAADAVIWDIDDAQVDILLATLNRLGGADILEKKLALLKKLSDQMPIKDLAKLLPQTAKQLERLTNLKMPAAPADAKSFATPMVFFLDDEQLAVVEDALFLAQLNCGLALPPVGRAVPARSLPNAAKRAAGLTEIARVFLERGPSASPGRRRLNCRSTAR
jgi:ParB/RepB/Spo0J family partition protein